MSFLRHEEIYRSDGRLSQSWERQPVSSLPVLIGYDEFPAGYSLAGCPPAEPASASPTGNDSQQPMLPYNDSSANGNNPLNFVSQPEGALQLSPFHPVQRWIELDCTHLPVLRFPKEIASPALAFGFLVAARIHSEASMLVAMRSGGISILFDQVGFR